MLTPPTHAPRPPPTTRLPQNPPSVALLRGPPFVDPSTKKKNVNPCTRLSPPPHAPCRRPPCRRATRLTSARSSRTPTWSYTDHHVLLCMPDHRRPNQTLHLSFRAAAARRTHLAQQRLRRARVAAAIRGSVTPSTGHPTLTVRLTVIRAYNSRRAEPASRAAAAK